MEDEAELHIFEITGDEIVGGMNSDHNQNFYDRIRLLEESALSIGKTLGMTSVAVGAASEPLKTVGFRFAESSAERYDVKGVEVAGQIPSEEIFKKLR